MWCKLPSGNRYTTIRAFPEALTEPKTWLLQEICIGTTAYEGNQVDWNEGRTLHRHHYHVQQMYGVCTGL